MRLRFAVAIAVLLAGLAPGSRADSFAEDSSEPHDVLPPRWTLRLAGGVAQPLADLANDNPREGWVGGQGTGFTLRAGVRIPLMRDVLVRPELSFYGFDSFHDTDLPVLVVDGSGAVADTVAGDWTRLTRMGGLRVSLDYIPQDRSLVSPFLTGGLGLVYMRVEDDILLEDYGDVHQHEETLGLSASLGVGLLVGALEIVAEGTFQEPGFSDVGSVSWFTADLSVGYSIPIAR